MNTDITTYLNSYVVGAEKFSAWATSKNLAKRAPYIFLYKMMFSETSEFCRMNLTHPQKKIYLCKRSPKMHDF